MVNAEWREDMMGRRAEADRDFWRHVLLAGGFTAIPRWTLTPVTGVAMHEETIPGDLLAALRQRADELGVPLSSMLLAAHARVLAALSGEHEVTTGYVAAPGGHPLPCRLTTEPGSWRALLLDTHRVEAALLSHKDFPIDDLRRELGLSGPSFETVLDPTGEGGELAEDIVLRVEFLQGCGELVLQLWYRTEVLNADCAARVAGYHRTALSLIVADPHAEHERQSLLSAEELHYQLEGLAGRTRELPGHRVHELFELQAAAQPDAVAAVYGERQWTYRDLNVRANRLGRALVARGLRREGVVAVVTERNLDWMAAVLAIFKAGGVYLPIEPHFPADRIATMLSRAECRLVLTEPGSATRLNHALASLPGVQTLLVDTASEEDHAEDNLGISVAPDQLAYIYFTSGSTGEPKGAMCEHAGLLNHLYAKIDDLQIGEGQVVAQTAPQCFDISLWQLVSALLVGGRTLLVEQEVILDVERFVDQLVDGQITVLQIVPSYLEVVLSYLEQHPRELPDLRCVSVTGEALKKELVQRWFAAEPQIKLVNAYGLTETSDDTNHEIMDRVPDRERVPLGRPINNVHVYVVDEHLSPMPLGAPGAIVFSGVCVGRGYVNDPERTRLAFLPDPHREGQWLYRGGDYGRWLPEGKLEFLGRRDSQVKIAGFRIELGEIENTLLRVPGVRDGAVVVAQRVDHNQRLVAFYSGPRELPADVLRDRLSASLPRYMVPSAFYWREHLPLTANSKIDRKRLSALAQELDVLGENYYAPRTPTEQWLAAAWAKVLGISQEGISRQDHFFERGGTSLAAVRLAILLERAVSLGDITRHPILADLARLVDFSLYKRPSPGCILSWNRSARDIDAFVRALDFGPYPNPMGLAKLAIERDFIIVSEIEVLNAISTAPPGTVTHFDASCIRVATRDHEIALRKLLTINGQPLPIADFVMKFGLYKGYQFKELDQEVAARITAYTASICQHEAFWTKQLETLENITLPYVHQKTPHPQIARHSYVSRSIPTEMLNALKNRYEPWPIGDVLLAAYAAYLARMAGVGSFDISFRDIELKSDVAGLEGFFAAYVPLHVIIEYEQCLEEVFHAVQERITLAKQRKTYARDIMARYPILRSKANSQGVHLPSNYVERVETLHDYKAPPDSELTLVIQEGGGECLWAYNTEVLNEESVVQMQQGFTTFLQGIASDPQQRISDLPLLTQKERQQMLVEWNATQAAYPGDKCVHQLFEAQVERSPDALAVVYKNEQVTYRELNRRANQLAHYLQKLGIGPEVLVGICVERSIDMVVGLLGVLKAGGAYVPLDPTYPAERLAFMLQDAQALVLLTQRRLASALPTLAVRPVYLDADWDIIAQESEANPANSVQPANLAYVIYTSGSTGKPKGVMIPHLGFVNYLSWCTQAYRVAEGQGTLVHSPLGFDLTITSLFSPLLVGQRTILLPEDQGIETLQTALRNGRDFTLLKITPAHVKLLSQELSAQEVAGRARALIIGGEALLGEDISFWHTYAPGTRLINEYGPTEAVVGCCIYEVPVEATLPGNIPIGRPIANTRLYLLDSHLQPVPINVPGELYIGGAGVARGYLNRPELTAERFIPDPFNQQSGARLYKTGDLARYLSDGTIEFLGRIDHQLKIRGFRIEPGEIETVLELHPAVRQAVVVAHEDTPGDKRLVAYVVLHEKQTATIGDLKSYVMKKVPTYMVPSALALLETLPLTPNGKVDRRGLPAPEHTRPELGEAFVAARTSIEEVVTGMWSQALGIEQIGIHDDFFALGGDSLLAIVVITRLRKVLQVQLSLAHFLEARTIAKLSRIIEQIKAGDAQQVEH